jgi:ATP-dependent protease ClpP protease subunit
MATVERKPAATKKAASPRNTALDASEIKRNEAEAAIYRAQAEGQLIDNELARHILTAGEYAAARESRKFNWEAAADQYHRVYHLNAEINEAHVEHAISVMSRWHRMDTQTEVKSEPYRVVICSPGGYIHYGMKLYAFLRNLAIERPIITIASGFCASMATIIHQAGTERWIDSGTSYLIHDPSGYAGGTIGDIEDTKEWMDQLKDSGHRILAERSTLSVEEIAARCKRRDWWMLSSEVVDLGFADKITNEVY